MKKRGKPEAAGGEARAQLAIVRLTLGIVLKAIAVTLTTTFLAGMLVRVLGTRESTVAEMCAALLATAITLPLLYTITLRPIVTLTAEHASAMAEARFQAIAHSVHDGIVIYDAERGIRFANEAVERIFGYEQGGLDGKPMEILMPEELRPAFQEGHEHYLRTKQSLTIGRGPVEREGLRASGELFPAEISVSELRGRQSEFVVVLRDIQARRQTEKALQDRTARVNALLTNSPMAIVVLDEAQRVQMCNPAFEKLFGYHAAEIAGAGIDEVVASEEERAEAYELTKRAGEGEVSHAITCRRRKDGSLVDVEVYGVPLVVEGKLAGAYAIYQDLTERKKLEDAARKSERRYRDLFEQANDGIVIFRPGDEVILDANPKAFALYRFSRAEFIGRSLKSLTKDVARSEESIAQLLNKGRAWDFESVYFRKDGQEMHLLCSGSLIDYQGEPAIMAVMHDITEQKKAEGSLRASEVTQRKLAEQQKAILDALPVAVRIVEGAAIVYVNSADARLHGYSSPQEEIGIPFIHHVALEDQERILDIVRRRDAGQPVPSRYRLRRRRKDGSEFDAECTVALNQYEGRKARLIVIEDLTERERLDLFEKLLPVCCVCGKVRDDARASKGQGRWERLDHYVAHHSDTQVSHTFCPECLREYRKREGIE